MKNQSSSVVLKLFFFFIASIQINIGIMRIFFCTVLSKQKLYPNIYFVYIPKYIILYEQSVFSMAQSCIFITLFYTK